MAPPAPSGHVTGTFWSATSNVRPTPHEFHWASARPQSDAAPAATSTKHVASNRLVTESSRREPQFHAPPAAPAGGERRAPGDRGARERITEPRMSEWGRPRWPGNEAPRR